MKNTLLLILTGTVLFATGLTIGYGNSPVEVIRIPQFVVIEKVVTIEKTVEVPYEVIVEKRIPMLPCDWDSENQLKTFLEFDLTNEAYFFSLDGNKENICWQYAYLLRDNAMENGWYLSVVGVTNAEYLLRFGINLNMGYNEYHCICMARIGQDEYLIEPKTDQIIKAYILK